MLSTRLIRMIEDHAEQLTQGLIHDLQHNPRTTHYHHLSREELHHRFFDVYRNLGNWLSHKTDAPIESAYMHLAKRRHEEGIPLNEVVYALIQLKHHLREYVRSVGLMDSAVELHQENELQRLVGSFFDKAIYYTVRGYEQETSLEHVRDVVRRGA